LGVISKVNYPTEKIQMNPGDRLILYTDGVVEIRNSRNEEYGVERLKKVVDRYGNLSASEMIQEIIMDTREFSGSQNYADDFTLVIVRRE
jgi:sigma-B regulation protein RsbU (phosphoserine phosphatase)